MDFATETKVCWSLWTHCFFLKNYFCSSFPSVDHSLDVVPVSLIVPCFNCVKFIEDTIVSISKQTFEGLIEIVFCDDGSVDGSFFEIQRLCSVHLSDRRRFLVTLLKNDVNRGAGFTRNRCIDSSLGKMLCFVDCDDIMDEKRIEMQMNDHVDDVEIVGCKMRCFPSDSPFYDFVNQLVDSKQLIDFRFREGSFLMYSGCDRINNETSDCASSNVVLSSKSLFWKAIFGN